VSAFDIPSIITQAVPKGAFIALMDAFEANAGTAYKLIKDHTYLTGRRANICAGMTRYHINEQEFTMLCPQYGGLELLGGALPNLDVAVYQPYHMFDNVLLGIATQFKSGELPKKNMSRARACQLNLGLEPMLPAPRLRVVPKNVFALLLLSRDSRDPAKLAGIEIAVIDASLDHFIFREPLGKFLERYSKAVKPSVDGSRVKLKGQKDTLAKIKPKFKKDAGNSD